MKVHFEATVVETHDGVITLDAQQQADYEAATPEQRSEWLADLVDEKALDGTDSTSREVTDRDWRVQD